MATRPKVGLPKKLTIVPPPVTSCAVSTVGARTGVGELGVRSRFAAPA